MAEYTFAEAAAAVGLSVRGLRVYVRKGLVPPVPFRGPATRYDEAWLTHLKAVRRLVVDKGVPLDGIQRRMAKLSPEEIAALAAERPGAGGAGATPRAAAATATDERDGEGEGGEGGADATEAHEGAREPAEVPVDFGGVRWEHVALLPGLELHLRADATPLVRRIAAEIAAHYGGFPEGGAG